MRLLPKNEFRKKDLGPRRPEPERLQLEASAPACRVVLKEAVPRKLRQIASWPRDWVEAREGAWNAVGSLFLEEVYSKHCKTADCTKCPFHL